MKKLSDCLNEAVAKPVTEVVNIISAWPKIVGQVNSSVSLPVSIKSGKLTVIVFDNMYLQGFQFIKEEILEKLNQENFIVNDIKFIYRAKKSRKINQKKFKDISEEEMKYVERYSSSIQNKKLRESFKRALESYFRVYSLEEFLSLEKD